MRIFFRPMAEAMQEAPSLASRTETQSRAVTDSPKQISHSLRSFRALVAAALFSVLPQMVTAGEPDPAIQSVTSQVRGSLVIAGGGPLPSIIRERFIELAGGKEAKIVFIPTASADADIPEKQHIFKWDGVEQHVKSATLFHTRDRDVANDEESTQVFDDATAVWISGGDQINVTNSYLNTKVDQKMQAILRRGGVIGGTSAGAAVMTRSMIKGYVNPQDRSSDPDMGDGFGFLQGTIVDQHFIKRNRTERLKKALLMRPGNIGLGIDEGTALIVRSDTCSVIGDSTVSVYAPNRTTELRPGDQATLESFGMPVMQVVDNRSIGE